ncbi:alpha/beta fold hydrolase [Actinospica robiniae]|uniref:alpha/beta fold hydrolase n=1 Tax=Actinospica robiniae TaxID=304901 RepID=UPI0004124CA0|nr:alpha/beta hydrolase [Actinospica robiniae]
MDQLTRAEHEGAALHVLEDGEPGAPTLLLIHGLGACTAWWDPVVPTLARSHHVIRVDLLGHGASTSPDTGYEISAQARRIGAVLDRLGVGRVAVAVGHSTGGNVATALAEERPELVAALALIDTGPNMAADTSDNALSRLLFRPFPGALLWRLFTSAIVRKSLSSAFTRPVKPPKALAEGARGMTHHALASTADASMEYLFDRPIPERLRRLGLPVLVIFGSADKRWSPSSADAYRNVPDARVEVLPGVGHTPMYEDPRRTCELLTEFAAAP